MSSKAGRLVSHDRKLFRYMKRTNGCEGCLLYDMISCPRMGRDQDMSITCIEDGLILTKPF